MTEPDFDAFYARSRAGLLLESFALTGDLPAARTAVRDAFASAWHHWRKVSRLDDPEAWVRTVAHSRAQRRHTARIWHRERHDAETTATLEGLAVLSGDQRKLLVLTHLAALSLDDISREVGVPRSEAERQLQTATALFSLQRDCPSTEIRVHLEHLRSTTDDQRWPRATIVRRAGAARRRTHTLVGVAATVGALLVAGTVVSAEGVPAARLDARAPTTPTVDPAAGGSGGAERERPAPPRLEENRLLTSAQVARSAPRLRWRERTTSTNVRGDGRVMPCQAERFADAEGLAALVRTFTGSEQQRVRTKRGKVRARSVPTARVVQAVELSRSTGAARRAYRTARSWYAGCQAPRTQLVSTHHVRRVGDEATLLVLRSWGGRPTTLAFGLARTGQFTVTTMTSGPAAGDTRAAARTLGAAVDLLCASDVAGRCAGRPVTRPATPWPSGDPPGMLSAFDLPPVPGVRGTWVGTPAHRTRRYVAATACAATSFKDPGIERVLTRSFVFPVERSRQLGLTEIVATMRERRARVLLADIQRRIRSCGEDNLGTEVTQLAQARGPQRELTAWRLDIEIADDESVAFLVAALRHRGSVAQVGFVPAARLTMSHADFRAVAQRALDRLANLRRKR